MWWAQGSRLFLPNSCFFSATENNNMQIICFFLFQVILSEITVSNRCFVFTNTFHFLCHYSICKDKSCLLWIDSHLSFCSRMLLERLKNFGTSKDFRICATSKQEKLCYFFVQITIYITYYIKLVMRSAIVHEHFFKYFNICLLIFERIAANLCLKIVNVFFFFCFLLN